MKQRLVVRAADRARPRKGAIPVAAPGCSDTQAMRTALEGVKTFLLVSGRESVDRVREHFSAIEAAIEAGAERIVYLSMVSAAPDATFTLAREHFATEERIRESGLRFTFLRSSVYADVTPFSIGDDGMIRAPAGTGRVAFVARDDVASVATAVLLNADKYAMVKPMTTPVLRACRWPRPRRFSVVWSIAQLCSTTRRLVKHGSPEVSTEPPTGWSRVG